MQILQEQIPALLTLLAYIPASMNAKIFYVHY